MNDLRPQSPLVLGMSEIFAATATIAHGPFKIHATERADIGGAFFFAAGHHVPLFRTPTQIMAVYIAHKGDPVTLRMLAEALPHTRISADNNRLVRAHISMIKSAIVKKLEPEMAGEAVLAITNCIAPLIPYKGTRKGDHSPEEHRGAYRITELHCSQ